VAFPVQGQDPQPEASAIVFFNPESNQASLFADGLQPLPEGQVYELWLLDPQHPQVKPTPAGIFRPDELGTALHTTDAPSRLRDYAGVAVTIEPGFMTEATGPIVLVGTYEVR
jgi:anti-sigma-K factor RskA